ncbi:MAG: NAD(P)H-dependent oxidoreductase subunit E [Candidatus Promineifilaceae bacterium]|nr:NAD(P)H-dependent oxidoreductase subunit E [Candidatus Promineifilaceae bacterium]
MSHPEIDLSALQPYLEDLARRLARADGDERRAMLLPALHHAQSLYGWLPRPVLEAISRALWVPLADIHGVVEFYTMFYNEPMARRVVRICEDPACALAGGEAVAAAIEAELGVEHGGIAPDGGEAVGYERVPCLGMCEFAPAALDGARPAGDLSPEEVPEFLGGAYPEPGARVYGGPFLTLGRVGQVDPGSLDDYREAGGYETVRRVVNDPAGPEGAIETLSESGVLGRGGAQFPLGLKWRYTRGAPGTPAEKHIIANADESEPGTFKDRVLMEQDPFSLLEAMTLAAYAVGAENGWIFIRGEYPRAAVRLAQAIEAAREAQLLGRGLFGRPNFHFDIELRLGAGAYICGEETALFEAIEGRRGFPRIKPPFPTTHGLFMQPTVVNNVETLVAALAVMRVGLDEWRALGTEDSPGTKWFCLSGHVERPGLYEVPFGLTLREMIEMAGGIPGERAVQAVLMGGAAGNFVGPEQLDTVLSYEGAREAGVPLGSGVIMVFDETVDLRPVLFQLSRFFAHESCGKCFPCQIGTQRQMEILSRVALEGGPVSGDRDALLDIGFTMTQTSLCGLGQTAASAVLSALERWPDLVPEQP